MIEWECNDCGEVHQKNPPKCESCGCTLLSRHRSSKERSPSTEGAGDHEETVKKSDADADPGTFWTTVGLLYLFAVYVLPGLLLCGALLLGLFEIGIL